MSKCHFCEAGMILAVDTGILKVWHCPGCHEGTIWHCTKEWRESDCQYEQIMAMEEARLHWYQELEDYFKKP